LTSIVVTGVLLVSVAIDAWSMMTRRVSPPLVSPSSQRLPSPSMAMSPALVYRFGDQGPGVYPLSSHVVAPGARR